MKWLWSTADRWGPGVVALVALLGTIWYGRSLEGRAIGLQAQISERTQVEIALRTEVQTWQAYVVSLKEAMIRAGIRDLPPPPRPVTLTKSGGRTEITTEKKGGK